MAVPAVISCDVFFDYLCPFVYRMAGLLGEVSASGQVSVDVRWRYFSLTQVNSREEGWTIWGAPPGVPARGRMAFAAAEAARRQGRFDALHMPLLQARHRDRLDIDSRDVVETVAAGAGLDLDRFRADLDDPTVLAALERDHRAGAAELGVFGTPTLVFDNGAAAYVRLAPNIEPSAALEIFERMFAVAGDEPQVLEIKRPVKPAGGES